MCQEMYLCRRRDPKIGAAWVPAIWAHIATPFGTFRCRDAPPLLTLSGSLRHLYGQEQEREGGVGFRHVYLLYMERHVILPHPPNPLNLPPLTVGDNVCT